jgi:hypothetical protein
VPKKTQSEDNLNVEEQSSAPHAASGTALVAVGVIGAAVATEFAAPLFVGLGLITGAVGAGLQIKDAIDVARHHATKK